MNFILIHFSWALNDCADGSEDGGRVKRVRADSAAVSREPAQALDAPDPEPGTAPAPPAFLSPSVKEYLELGMAIPGKFVILPLLVFKVLDLVLRSHSFDCTDKDQSQHQLSRRFLRHDRT